MFGMGGNLPAEPGIVIIGPGCTPWGVLIFADHQTAAYVSKVREVPFLTPEVAVKSGEDWQIALFQNTPAQFHDRPELVEHLTNELRQVLRAQAHA